MILSTEKIRWIGLLWFHLSEEFSHIISVYSSDLIVSRIQQIIRYSCSWLGESGGMHIVLAMLWDKF